MGTPNLETLCGLGRFGLEGAATGSRELLSMSEMDTTLSENSSDPILSLQIHLVHAIDSRESDLLSMSAAAVRILGHVIPRSFGR